MLCDLPTLKTSGRIQTSDTSQDNYLASLLVIADRAVKLFTKRDLETNNYTEYFDGSGVEGLVLNQRPVTVAGIQVWLDAKGFGGQVAGAFASSTLLTAGMDYMVDSQDGITSKNGVLRRLAAGSLADFGSFAWAFRRGSLTAYLPAGWSRGFRNVKVTYTAGFGTGATAPSSSNPEGGILPNPTTIPVELTNAVCKLALWERALMPVGVALDTEVNAKQVAAILNGGAGSDEPEIMSVRGMLRRYREIAM